MEPEIKREKAMGQKKYAFNFLAEDVENKLKREVRPSGHMRLSVRVIVYMYVCVHARPCDGYVHKNMSWVLSSLVSSVRARPTLN